MRIAPKDRARVKLQILRLIATLRLDPEKMDLIAGFMENYLTLDAKEELAFQRALDNIEAGKERNAVMELITTWERKGRQEGRLVTLKGQLRVLVGKLTTAQERTLESLDESDLAELAEALLDFSSTKDLDRWLARRSPAN